MDTIGSTSCVLIKSQRLFCTLLCVAGTTELVLRQILLKFGVALNTILGMVGPRERKLGHAIMEPED